MRMAPDDDMWRVVLYQLCLVLQKYALVWLDCKDLTSGSINLILVSCDSSKLPRHGGRKFETRSSDI